MLSLRIGLDLVGYRCARTILDFALHRWRSQCACNVAGILVEEIPKTAYHDRENTGEHCLERYLLMVDGQHLPAHCALLPREDVFARHRRR